MLYAGGYLVGDRYGRGTSFDPNSNVQRDSYWLDGNEAESIVLPYIDLMRETLEIGHAGFNELPEFTLTCLGFRITEITISNNNIQNVHHFTLDGLLLLEKLVIGDRCASNESTKTSNGLFRVSNCPALSSISIGAGSFQHYRSFEVFNLPSLKSLSISSNRQQNQMSFYHCTKVVFESMLSIFHCITSRPPTARINHSRSSRLRKIRSR